jgi:hypothetical protein
LGNAKPQRRLGDGAEVGDGYEGSRVPQVHAISFLCRIGING